MRLHLRLGGFADSGHAWSGSVQQQVRRAAGSGQVRYGCQDGAHLVQEKHWAAHPGGLVAYALMDECDGFGGRRDLPLYLSFIVADVRFKQVSFIRSTHYPAWS